MTSRRRIRNHVTNPPTGGVNEDNKASALLPDCCACDVAKYKLEFEGAWSRESHPNQFPYS